MKKRRAACWLSGDLSEVELERCARPPHITYYIVHRATTYYSGLSLGVVPSLPPYHTTSIINIIGIASIKSLSVISF